MDQFYTKPSVAIACYEIFRQYIDINEFDRFLEPSAGTGSFFKLLPADKKLGLDLEPKYPGIIEQDFFTYIPEPNINYAVIGNPPFGRISSTAIKFFNKSASFASVIAFIIPKTFKRISVQNKLDLTFHNILNHDLPITPCCFEPKMNAKCCFQIWIKKNTYPRKIINLPTHHPDFKFLAFGEKDENGQPTPPRNADFALLAYGGQCGRLVLDELDKLRPKSWHWIVSNIDKQLLIQRLSQLDYKSICEDTVRQNSLGKKELIQLYASTFI